MWEIGLSLWWYFVTECRSIQVIGQGSGRESPHGSRNFQRTRRALRERERERERESPNGISQQAHDPRRLWCIGDEEFELTPIKARKKNVWEFELHPCLICGHAIVFLTSKSASTGGNEETSHNCNGGQRRSVSYRRISGPLYTRSHGWAKLGANFEHFWPLVWPPSYYQRGVSHCGLAIYIKKES